MKARVFRYGSDHAFSLGVVRQGIFVEIIDPEVNRLLWRLFKDNCSVYLSALGALFFAMDFIGAVRDMLRLVFTLGGKGSMPLKPLRDICKSYKKTGHFILPFGDYSIIFYGLRNAANYCVKTLKIPIADVIVEDESLESFWHKSSGRVLCKHKKCGGIAFHVNALSYHICYESGKPVSYLDRPYISNNTLRSYPDSTTPVLKDGPCWTCGEMLGGDQNLEFEECSCDFHKRKDTIHV